MIADGILTLYALENTAAPGRMPTEKLVEQEKAYYENRVIGVTRIYAAKGAKQQIDKLVRIWRNESIEIGWYLIPEDGVQYRIDEIQHLYDDDRLKVTDLTLSRLEQFYDVAESA